VYLRTFPLLVERLGFWLKSATWDHFEATLPYTH